MKLQCSRGLSTAESAPADERVFASAKRASMQPRSFNRGKVAAANTLGTNADRFNAAAVFQPRKDVESCVLSHLRYRFNAAAVFQPRRATEGCGCRGMIQASMQPRSFNRGKSAWHRRNAWRVCASMQPRSFNRGKLSSG